MEQKKTIQDKANTITFTLMICLMMIASGLILGYYMGYVQGLIDYAALNGLNEFEQHLNLTQNVSDYIIKEVSLK